MREGKASVLKRFEYKGRTVLVVSHPMGHPCVYAETKLKDWSYSQELPDSKASIESVANVHGGVTFSGKLSQLENMPRDGKSYFGIDFAHAGDYSPLLREGRRWMMAELIEEGKKLVDEILKYEEMAKMELTQVGE